MINLTWKYIPWLIGIIIALYFLFKALKRIIKGIISYRRLGKKEFNKRLKEGFENITPTQRTKGEINGIVVSLIGMIFGIIIMFKVRVEGIWYWAVISLIGGTIVTIFQLIGKIQNYQQFKKQDEILEQINKESIEND